MGKSPNLIADIGRSPNIDHEKDMADNGAPEGATKVLYVMIAVAMVALFALVAVGLHIPAGS